MTPAPIMALVREWRAFAATTFPYGTADNAERRGILAAERQRARDDADKLEAALKAWAEQLDLIANQQSGTLTINSIKWRVLGVEEK